MRVDVRPNDNPFMQVVFWVWVYGGLNAKKVSTFSWKNIFL